MLIACLVPRAALWCLFAARSAWGCVDHFHRDRRDSTLFILRAQRTQTLNKQFGHTKVFVATLYSRLL